MLCAAPGGRLATGRAAILADAFCHAVEPWILAPDVPEGQGADVISCSLHEDTNNYIISGDPIDLALDRVRSDGRDGKGTPFCWAADNAASDMGWGCQDSW